MTTAVLLQHFLMYGVVPVWLMAGFADWQCHRRARIEATSGVSESLLHIAQFGQVGVPLLAALFLEVDAAILLLMLVGLALHQGTAIWDVRYADRTRRIAPAEQHVHGVLEAAPALATAMVAILHWDQLLALFGTGNAAASFALQLKRTPLPTWYLAAVLGGVLAFGVLPYGEELLRTLRASGRRRSAGAAGARRLV